MVALSIGSVEGFTLDVVAPPAISGCVGTPVEGRRNNVVTALRVCIVVSTTLHKIDFTGFGPRAVAGIGGQHPDLRPEPISCGQLRFDLDTSVLDVCAELGVDAPGLDRVDDGSVGGVCGGNTVVPKLGCAGSVGQEVDGRIGLDQAGILEGRLDVKDPIVHINVLFRRSGLLELSVSTVVVSTEERLWVCVRCCLPVTTKLDFLGPNTFVEAIRPVLHQHWAVVEVGHTRDTIIDQESRQTQTDKDAEDWNDGNPFLLGVDLVQPWLLDLSLLDTSGVEVSWCRGGRYAQGRARGGGNR